MARVISSDQLELGGEKHNLFPFLPEQITIASMFNHKIMGRPNRMLPPHRKTTFLIFIPPKI